ncbi:hypothetical protein ASD54_07690 [Rhizobium sp. Root149]|nr:hypothetical protein ASD54_07690 [Rhizobium sp. Root149]
MPCGADQGGTVEKQFADRRLRVSMESLEYRLGEIDVEIRNGHFSVCFDVEVELFGHVNIHRKRVRINGICSYFVHLSSRVKGVPE